jgi:hypothetical protein
MSSKIILLITVLVSSAVFFAAIWQDKAPEPTPISSESPVIEPQLAPLSGRSVQPGAQRSSPLPDAARADSQLRSAARPPSAAQRPSVAPYTAYTDAGPTVAGPNAPPLDGALPIQIRFRHMSDIIEATIVNVSKEELTVNVSVLHSGSQTSQTTLDLAPGIPVVFGVRDGIELHSADEVRLLAADYRESLASVP